MLNAEITAIFGDNRGSRQTPMYRLEKQVWLGRLSIGKQSPRGNVGLGNKGLE